MKELSDETFGEVRKFVRMMANACRACVARHCSDCDFAGILDVDSAMDKAQEDRRDRRIGENNGICSEVSLRYRAVVRACTKLGETFYAGDIAADVEMTRDQKRRAINSLVNNKFLLQERDEMGRRYFRLNPEKSESISRLAQR